MLLAREAPSSGASHFQNVKLLRIQHEDIGASLSGWEALELLKYVLRLRSPQLLFGSVFIVVTALALYPDLILPEFALAGRYSDSIYHLAAFLMLTVTAMIATGRMVLVIVWMAALALLLEVLQKFIPGRGVFLSDAIASLLGVGLSWPLLIIAACLQRWWGRTTPPSH